MAETWDAVFDEHNTKEQALNLYLQYMYYSIHSVNSVDNIDQPWPLFIFFFIKL